MIRLRLGEVAGHSWPTAKMTSVPMLLTELGRGHSVQSMKPPDLQPNCVRWQIVDDTHTSRFKPFTIDLNSLATHTQVLQHGKQDTQSAQPVSAGCLVGTAQIQAASTFGGIPLMHPMRQCVYFRLGQRTSSSFIEDDRRVFSWRACRQCGCRRSLNGGQLRKTEFLGR